MTWQMPKTDWKPTDFHNADDYNRQAGNIMYIANVVLPALAYPVQVYISTVTRQDMRRAEWYIHLEEGLAAIESSGVPLPPEWKPRRIWTVPTWQDANRWEGNVLAIYNMAQRIAAEWPRMGTFESGGMLI